jgi:hypothetical protein
MKTVTDEEIGRAAVEWARLRRIRLSIKKADCSRWDHVETSCLTHNRVSLEDERFGNQMVPLCNRCEKLRQASAELDPARRKLEGLLRSALSKSAGEVIGNLPGFSRFQSGNPGR